jgi:hypothetical protein
VARPAEPLAHVAAHAAEPHESDLHAARLLVRSYAIGSRLLPRPSPGRGRLNPTDAPASGGSGSPRSPARQRPPCRR